MDFPEIDQQTALLAKPWQLNDPVHKGAIYIDYHLSYDQFFKDIFLKNQLCVLGPSVTSHWASKKDWVSEDGSPNFNFLVENYGETTASVADCNKQEFSTHPKTDMLVKNYINYWQEQKFQAKTKEKCLYLKDWHFQRHFPLYNAYIPPSFLCSDWMNEFWDVRKDMNTKDDYRFVYMGPKHSWTPFHVDVLHSYSWSANICGQKKWILFPPGCETKLLDKHKQMAFDIRSDELKDSKLFPEALMALEEAITVFQNPGEIIFIPSGWYHQVINLDDTISINHNWINGCNCHLVWTYIRDRLNAIQKEIRDCKDMKNWNDHCQVILKADSGMNYIDFYNFLATIANHRVRALHSYLMNTLLQKYVQRFLLTDSVYSMISEHSCSNRDAFKNPMGSLPSNNVISCDVVVALLENTSVCDTKIVTSETLLELKFLHCVECVTLDSSVIVFVDDNFNHDFSGFQTECFSNSCDNGKVKTDDKTSDHPISLSLEDSHKLQNTPVQLQHVKELEQRKQSKTKCQDHLPCQECLCLRTGTVIHYNSKSEYSNEDLIQDPSVQSSVSLCKHHHCPHWAHCGHYLAFFDIQRVLELVRNMVDEADFQELLANTSNKSSLIIPPPELIHSIENILDLVKLI
ncbi:2-oxoglutarate and iron-dependent oxygenase JMJD4 isoform X2 [Biomphalaria glabrata]|nr:2-oxoglutarate and iron-dependent oxygenase JMJD4 isoform X2 [Biomphalaria glabrata]